MKKLIIVGDAAFAEIAYEYFTHDSDYQVVGFSVEKDFMTKDFLFGLPIIPFENMTEKFAPKEHCVFVALTYGQLNRNRRRLYEQAKDMGYQIASYISSKAFVWPNVKIGENCFIFEDNTIQPFVTIGDNTILWSGNHIGHHSKIGSHVFISSHVVISGFVVVNDSSFIGVNSTLVNNIEIAEDSWIGPGCTILKNTTRGSIYKPNECEQAKLTSYRYFKIKEPDERLYVSF